jgi:hypothetical protein
LPNQCPCQRQRYFSTILLALGCVGHPWDPPDRLRPKNMEKLFIFHPWMKDVGIQALKWRVQLGKWRSLKVVGAMGVISSFK